MHGLLTRLISSRKDKDMRTWTHAASIRALKTFCQCAVGIIGPAVAITDVDWKFVLSASALAAIASILTSLGGLPEVESEDE